MKRELWVTKIICTCNSQIIHESSTIKCLSMYDTISICSCARVYVCMTLCFECMSVYVRLYVCAIFCYHSEHVLMCVSHLKQHGYYDDVLHTYIYIIISHEYVCCCCVSLVQEPLSGRQLGTKRIAQHWKLHG